MPTSLHPTSSSSSDPSAQSLSTSTADGGSVAGHEAGSALEQAGESRQRSGDNVAADVSSASLTSLTEEEAQRQYEVYIELEYAKREGGA